MKYIKKFESSKKEKFWIIPTDQPHLAFAFKKIGMSSSEVDHWIRQWGHSDKEILIFNNGYDWTWAQPDSKDYDGIQYIKHPNYENMGRVYIEDHEVNAEKYNI